MLYIGGLTRTKNAIISGLRMFFENTDNYKHLLPQDLMSDDIFSRMNIYDAHPQTLRTFPLIVVAGSNGRMINSGISNNFASEVYDRNNQLEGYLYAAMYEFSLDIEIGCKSTLEREVLLDLVASCLKFSIRRRLEYYGILIKEVSYGGENKLQYDSNFIYTAMLNIQTFSEWSEYYKLIDITDVNVKIKNNQKKKQEKSWYIPVDHNINMTEDTNWHIYDRIINEE